MQHEHLNIIVTRGIQFQIDSILLREISFFSRVTIK